MMSKKMKRVSFDSSSYGVYDEDAKARAKHQGLLQDYQDLQKEAEAARNRLEIMKQKKLTLLAEVSFLRRRCKYLRKNKTQQPPLVEESAKQLQLMGTYQQKLKKKDQSHSKKEATLSNLPPIYNINQKGRIYMQNQVVPPNVDPVKNLKQKKNYSRIINEASPSKATPAPSDQKNKRKKINGGKEVVSRKLIPAIDLNQKEWTNNGTTLRNSVQDFNLGQKGSYFSSKEANVMTTRAPIFDLNEISMEEEEYQEKKTEPFRFEESKEVLVRSGGLNEQQENDTMLSMCRNNSIRDASTSRPGKRKISWQDPVALRV